MRAPRYLEAVEINCDAQEPPEIREHPHHNPQVRHFFGPTRRNARSSWTMVTNVEGSIPPRRRRQHGQPGATWEGPGPSVAGSPAAEETSGSHETHGSHGLSADATGVAVLCLPEV